MEIGQIRAHPCSLLWGRPNLGWGIAVVSERPCLFKTMVLILLWLGDENKALSLHVALRCTSGHGVGLRRLHLSLTGAREAVEFRRLAAPRLTRLLKCCPHFDRLVMLIAGTEHALTHGDPSAWDCNSETVSVFAASFPFGSAFRQNVQGNVSTRWL